MYQQIFTKTFIIINNWIQSQCPSTMRCISRLWKVKVKVLVTQPCPRTVAHQAPLAIKFSTQEWVAIPFSMGSVTLENQGIEPRSPADSLPSEPPGKPISRSWSPHVMRTWQWKWANYTHTWHHRRISQTYWVKEAMHKEINSAWFHLHTISK